MSFDRKLLKWRAANLKYVNLYFQYNYTFFFIILMLPVLIFKEDISGLSGVV